jgi:hypothetical protein
MAQSKTQPAQVGDDYFLPMEILKKRGQEEGVGTSSGLEVHKKEALVYTDSDEEDTQSLEHKKRTLPIFVQLPEQAMLIGKDVNEIISIAFIGDTMAKKPKTGISPSKVLYPQPISSTIPCTRSMARESHIIDIQDDPKLDTIPSTTIMTKQPPSPLQPYSPPQETAISSQTIDLKLM